MGFVFGAVEGIITHYMQSNKSKELIEKIKRMSKGYKNIIILFNRFKDRLLLEIPIGKDEYKDKFKDCEKISDRISKFEEIYENSITYDDEKNKKIEKKYDETGMMKCLEKTIFAAAGASADSVSRVGAGIGIAKVLQTVTNTSTKCIINKYIYWFIAFSGSLFFAGSIAVDGMKSLCSIYKGEV